MTSTTNAGSSLDLNSGRRRAPCDPLSRDRQVAGIVESASQLPRRVRVERGIYRNPATGRLEIQWRDDTGRTRWRTVGGSLSEARRARAKAQEARRSFASVAEEWLAGQTRVRARTFEGYARALDRHILPRIGERPVASVDEDAIVNLITELEAEGLAGWTIRGVLVPLGRVLNHATRHKLITHNPMRRLERNELPRVRRREMRILNAEEIEALLSAATPTYRLLLATAVFTGLRLSELLGLQWRDVDLDNRILRARRQLDRYGHYTEPKSPRSHRAVELISPLAELLAKHHASSGSAEPTAPVFVSASGKPLYYRNVTRAFAAAVAEAGLNHEGEPRVRFHDLRCTFAAMLIASGLNVIYVSRQLGHAYPSFTLNHYGGFFDRAEYASRANASLEPFFPAILPVGGSTESPPPSEKAAERPR